MKSVKEFEYEIWTTEEEGEKKYWVRVKHTDEVTQVSLPVLRLLRCEEKRIRREREKKRIQGKDLSLNTLANEDVSEYWLADRNDPEKNIVSHLMEEELIEKLTPRQADVFLCCMVEGMSIREYCRQHHRSIGSVMCAVNAIRKKFKNIYFETRSKGEKMSVR